MSRRGASLLEVMLVCALLLALAAIGLQSSHHQRAQADTQGLAQALAGRLTGSRELAMRLGEPVALAFPSQNGTRQLASGCYELRGFERARWLESWSFAGEYPETGVFAGSWSAGAWLDRQRDCAGSGLDVTSWNRADPRDPVVVFLPNGAALSSQPLVQGAFRLVVCQALEARSGSLLGRPSWRLSRVQAPVTLAVTPEGRVSLETGLVPAGGVELVTEGLTRPASATCPPGPGGANADPALVGAVQVEPAPIVAGLPAGVDATVGAGSHLSLVVRASDPDGDRLTCFWNVTGPPGEPAGAFSQPGNHRMSWDESAGNWLSRWEWVPPPGAEGKIYTLGCRVRDERGRSILATVGAGGRILVVPRGRIAFQGANGTEIELINADGSDRASLTRGRHGSVCNPEFSPDGTKLVFLSWLGGTPNNNQAIVMDADGRNEVVVASGPIVGASWTPDGTQIVYTVFSPSPRQLEYYVTRLGDHVPGPAPPPVKVGSLPYAGIAPDPDVRGSNPVRSLQAAWVPATDRRFLASYPLDLGGGVWRWELAEVEVATGAVQSFGVEADAPRLNGAGDRVLFLESTGVAVASAPYSPGTLGPKTTLAVSFGDDLGQPSWSPDGTQIVLDHGGQLYECDAAGNNLRPLDLVPGGMVSASWSY